MTLDYHAKFEGMIFREVVRGKPRPPRRIRVVADTVYDVGAVVIEGRGKHKPLSVHRKHIIDPTRWVLEE